MNKVRKMIKALFFRCLLLLGLLANAHANANGALLEDIYTDALNVLPNKLISSLSSDLKIKAARLNKVKIDLCLNDIPDRFIYASYNAFFNQIKFAKSLLKSARRCPAKLRKVLLKKMVHELFHVYDIKSPTKPIETNLFCKRIKARKSQQCKDLDKQKKRWYKISDSVIFKNAVMIKGRTGKDFKGLRALAPYEATNIAEFSAVNFEAFIYDKNYQCRRPSLYRYFSKHFDHTPYKGKICNTTNKVYEKLQTFDLDPARIYQVDYLLATKGQAIYSRFGHSKIRLAVCAPTEYDQNNNVLIEATPYGEGCLKDLDHHIVITFNASIPDGNIEMIKGIDGTYPAIMSIQSLRGAMREYNQIEFRDLNSYKLNFDEKTKNHFIKRVQELFWDYKGSYKFFSANCASAIYKMIAGSFDNIDINLERPVTPYGVLEALGKHKIIDIENLTEKFRSKSYFLNLIFKNLNRYGMGLKDLDTYFQYDAQERFEIFSKYYDLEIASLSFRERKKIISSLIVLENHLLATQKQELLERGHKALQEEEEEETKESLLDEQSFILQQGYGIPSVAEFQKLTKGSKSLEESFAQKQIQVEEILNNDLSFRTLKAEGLRLIDNLNWLKRKLKQKRTSK